MRDRRAGSTRAVVWIETGARARAPRGMASTVQAYTTMTNHFDAIAIDQLQHITGGRGPHDKVLMIEPPHLRYPDRPPPTQPIDMGFPQLPPSSCPGCA